MIMTLNPKYKKPMAFWTDDDLDAAAFERLKTYKETYSEYAADGNPMQPDDEYLAKMKALLKKRCEEEKAVYDKALQSKDFDGIDWLSDAQSVVSKARQKYHRLTEAAGQRLRECSITKEQYQKELEAAYFEFNVVRVSFEIWRAKHRSPVQSDSAWLDGLAKGGEVAAFTADM